MREGERVPPVKAINIALDNEYVMVDVLHFVIASHNLYKPQRYAIYVYNPFPRSKTSKRKSESDDFLIAK